MQNNTIMSIKVFIFWCRLICRKPYPIERIAKLTASMIPHSVRCWMKSCLILKQHLWLVTKPHVYWRTAPWQMHLFRYKYSNNDRITIKVTSLAKTNFVYACLICCVVRWKQKLCCWATVVNILVDWWLRNSLGQHINDIFQKGRAYVSTWNIKWLKWLSNCKVIEG